MRRSPKIGDKIYILAVRSELDDEYIGKVGTVVRMGLSSLDSSESFVVKSGDDLVVCTDVGLYAPELTTDEIEQFKADVIANPTEVMDIITRMGFYLYRK